MVKLVGILNITPDSFSDGGKFVDPKQAAEHVARLFSDGASLVDVGAESTRPHATPLSADQEWERLERVLPALLKKYPGKISLDSYHPETIEKALALGQVIVNDVTGLNNPAMVDVIKKHRPMVIISHHPDMTIQRSHDRTPVSEVSEVVGDLLKRAGDLENAGVPRSRIILDPGIGFGKTPDLNKKLLKFAKHVPDYAVMIGYSRKRFLGDKRMEIEPNLAAGKIATDSGATYLRVHDVAAHRSFA